MIAGLDYTGVAVAFICHDGQGNFLFHKRSQHTRDEHGKWDWGAGKLKFGESVEEALAREIKEEYACDIVSIDEALPVTVWNSRTAGRVSHWITLTHIITVNRKQAKNNEPRSIDEIGWFKFNELPNPLHKGVAEKVIKFKKNIEKFAK